MGKNNFSIQWLTIMATKPDWGGRFIGFSSMTNSLGLEVQDETAFYRQRAAITLKNLNMDLWI